MLHPKRFLILISCLILVMVVYFHEKLNINQKLSTQGRARNLDVHLKNIRTTLSSRTSHLSSEVGLKRRPITAVPVEESVARYSIIKSNERSARYFSRENEENEKITLEPDEETTVYMRDFERTAFITDETSPLAQLTEEAEHVARVDILRNRCRKLSLYKKPFARKSLTDFFYSRKNNFAYCKVPKSGSTLWMKLFMALVKGDNYTRAMANLPRMEFHKRSKILKINPSRIIATQVPTVVVSRNPYSRLYSAYVDKVYLPLFWSQFSKMDGAFSKQSYLVNFTQEVFKGTKKAIGGRLLKYRANLRRKGLLISQNISRTVTPVCANYVTFEQFLSFIITNAKANNVLEPHWAPISSLCQPCRLNTFRIVRQESFSKDVEQVLKSVNIDLEDYPSIRETLYENRAKNTIPGIVGVVQQWVQTRNVKSCITPKEVIRRVWKSLQIQGFIRDSEQLPDSLREEHVFRNVKVLNAILENIHENPMTPVDSKQQRYSHLVDAYKSVRSDIIEQIQDIYRNDFVLFNYSVTPPV